MIMRVNARGGYDVILKRVADNRYLKGDDIGIIDWTRDKANAYSTDTDDDMLDEASLRGIVAVDGELPPEYVLEHLPWVNPDLETDPRFYDEDADMIRYDEVARYVYDDSE